MKEFFDFLEKYEVTPNGHYILYCMVNDQPIGKINYLHEQHCLSLSEYLRENISEDGSVFYTLTQKAIHFVHESEAYICNLPTIKAINKISYKDWEERIKEYNEMFPKGKRRGSSLSFRTNPKELYDRFKWFFTEYPEYDWEMVMNVTKKYVETFETSCDYTYMQSSKYFIKKEDRNKTIISTLATMCYNTTEGDDEEVSTGTYYFGP
jgi:hypothetical protein